MDEKTYHKLNLVSLSKNGGKTEWINEFSYLNKWFLEVIQSLYESKANVCYYQTELESKYIRFGFANQSIINLSKNFKINVRSKDISIIDIFSIYSISRMQFESFIIIYYLFYDNITETEKEFRYNIYKLHGLLKQLSFPVSFKQAIVKKERIQQDANNLRKSISESKFDEYRTLMKDPLTPKRAKYINTEEAFRIAKLNKGQLKHYWGILSNHLHSEHISDRQYSSFLKDKKELESSLTLAIEVSMILTSRLIINLKNAFKGVEIYYNTIPMKAQVYIETLNDLSKKI